MGITVYKFICDNNFFDFYKVLCELANEEGKNLGIYLDSDIKNYISHNKELYLVSEPNRMAIINEEAYINYCNYMGIESDLYTS